MYKLKDVLKFVSYGARLQIVTKDEYGILNYVFPHCDLITKEVIEKSYPGLLLMELVDGIHGEGNYDGIYIILGKGMKKETISKINRIAQNDFDKARLMLDNINKVLGTQYGWLYKRVVFFDNPNGTIAEKYKGTHDAWAYAED